MIVLSPPVIAILMHMVNLNGPGKSVYSQVLLDRCDEVCQQTLLCNNPADWRCTKPKFDKETYEDNLTELQIRFPKEKFEDLAKEAKELSFTRPETYEESLARYITIAQAATDVSNELTRSKFPDKKLFDECKDSLKYIYASDDQIPKKCLAIKKQRPWRWSSNDLRLMIITVVKYESGFRRDVHSGHGPASRGDCEWRDSLTHKWAEPGAKGAYKIKGSCKSVCLGQINLGSKAGGTTINGWGAEDLVGIDYESTKRCFTAIGHTLAAQRNRCTGFYAAKTSDWALATFTGYGTGGKCSIPHQWPGQRSTTFWKMRKHPAPDNQKVLSFLNKPQTEFQLSQFIDTETDL